MRNLMFIPFFVIFSIVIIESCKKDKAVPQAINYYDFPDVVVRYPSDTSVINSMSFALTSGSQNDLIAFAYINNYFGNADSLHSNKFISISSNSSYELVNHFYGYCCETTSINNLINPADFNISTLNHYSWTHHEIIYSDLNFGGISQNCNPGFDEFYIPIRNIKNNEHYAGWLRCLLFPDSIVFYDCAFSQQIDLSIHAGQH